MNQKLKTNINKYKSWMIEQALPFWSSVGFDHKSGSSHERILANGLPDYTANKRARVQARQIFTFAMAAKQGWISQKEALIFISSLQAYLEKYAIHPNYKSIYIHLLGPDNSAIDLRQDIYDFAFFMLANAWSFKISDDANALKRSELILNHIDQHLLSPHGGYLEGDYSASFRRQNPHMHLFEALLSLYQFTNDQKYLTKANQIFVLFERHFYDSENSVLLEYFANDWKPEIAKQVVEPGHMLEWVWLLDWYSRLSAVNTDQYKKSLYQRTYANGIDPETGLLFDGLSVRGEVLDAKKRCWPLTELIKANLVMAKLGEPNAEGRAAEAIELLFEYFISKTVPGSYVDHYDQNGQLIIDYAPASSMYHLAMACGECCDFLNAI